MQAVGPGASDAEVLHFNVGTAHQDRTRLRAELRATLKHANVRNAAIFGGKSLEAKGVAHAPAARFLRPFHRDVQERDIVGRSAEENAMPEIADTVLRIEIVHEQHSAGIEEDCHVGDADELESVGGSSTASV